MKGRAEGDVREYVESQAHEPVVHLEKVGSELVGRMRHDIWDVHCPASRWWVVTNPMYLYTQEDFKSRDVVLTFHVGLMLRVMYRQEHAVPVTLDAAVLLPGSWRRWEQAAEVYAQGDEAEYFQAVGVHLRECLVSFIGETCSGGLVPEGGNAPKGSDFRGWSGLLAEHLAAGPSTANLRSYLKKRADETWEYVNWLTHAKNAIRMDADIGLKAVEHLLGTFTAARLRKGISSDRCEECGAYALAAGVCGHCAGLTPATSHRSCASGRRRSERSAWPSRVRPARTFRRSSGRTISCRAWTLPEPWVCRAAPL